MVCCPWLQAIHLASSQDVCVCHCVWVCHAAPLFADRTYGSLSACRIPQIVLNHRRGNTGELSMFTCLLNLAGCIARLYTTTVLTQDSLILAGTATQTVLNSILITQILISASRQKSPPSGPQPTLL